mmetsp:Transcript_58960/g.164764  ORF Transcript_58960/g.164764 Transcript_58960/m.164764 type:complete len:456 (-) Transcript_58960:210-1577(-)
MLPSPIQPMRADEIQRVSGAAHSYIYANVFTASTRGEDTVNSAPASDVQRPICSCFCCYPGPPPAGIYDPELRSTLKVDAEANTLLVSSGYTFQDCRPALDAAGLVLRGTPEADTITVGGAVAVGAHGGGLYQKPLSGYVLEVWIRDARGEVQLFAAGDRDFSAAAVSLGLLGIILKVKFQCFRPEGNRKVTAVTVSEYSAAGIDSARADTHSYQFAPYMQRMVRYDESETDEFGPNSLARCYRGVQLATTPPCAACGIDLAVACCPCLACVLSQALVCPGECIFNRFDTFTPLPANYAYDLEYSVDVSVAGQVFDELRSVVDGMAKRFRYVTYRFSCRYVGAVDESWVLALSAGADKVAFEFVFSQKQLGVDEFLDSIIAVFQKFRGRPHLGKTIRAQDVAYVARVYGSTGGGKPFLEFDEARRRYDPQGFFLNDALRAFVDGAVKEARRAQQS